MTAIFIVGLPCDNCGVIAITFGDRLCDPRALRSVSQMAETIMSPRSKFAWLAPRINRNHVRHLINQPFGRRCGRRTEDNTKPCVAKRFNRTVKPAPIELTGFRLNPAPREFTNADARKTHFDHAPRIIGPPIFGPLFGVVANAKPHRFVLGHACKILSRVDL